MQLRSLLTGAVMMIPALAAADAPRMVAVEDAASPYDVVVGPENADGYQFGRQFLPAAPAAASLTGGGAPAVAASRTVYLNKNGVTLTPGINDSRANRSSIVKQQVTIPPWSVSASVWAETVSCMREVFAPFNIAIVETDPGANVPHIEAVFGGTPTQLGMASNLAGVSPFFEDCSVIENSVVFTFMGALPADAATACEIQAQEVAHSYGLDHTLVANDLMTYLPYDGRRWFQNLNASCGEDKARPCGLNGSTCRANQNSVTTLIDRVGLKVPVGDTTAPTVGITSPKNGDTVPPTFSVKFTAQDNTKVLMASLYVDGVPSGSAMLAPFSITTPNDLPEGAHKLRIVVTDGANEKSEEVTVNVRKGALGAGQEQDVVGGCAAGGGGAGTGAGLGLGLALGALLRRSRRARS